MWFLLLVSFWEVVTCILIFCGYSFWSAWFARVICPLMQEHSLRLKKLIDQALEDAMLKIRRPVYKRIFKSNCVLRADQKSDVNQTCVLANGSLHQDLMHSGCCGTTVPNVCLQTLTLCLLSSRDFFHLFPKQRASSQAITDPKHVFQYSPWFFAYFFVFLLTSRKCRKGRSANSIA